MGKRVHVAKRYEVEYGNTEAFNWKDDKFYAVLEMLGGEPNYVNGDSDSPSDMFECTVNDYVDAVENLKVYIESPEVYSASDHAELMEAIMDTGETPESLLKIMQGYLTEADTHDGYLHFASF